MTYTADLEREPWRFDFYAVLRRIERSFPDRPRIGDSASRRDEYVVLGEDPYLDFPASNLSKAERDAHGRLRILAKFLGLLGPQGALPLATTEEAYAWHLTRDEAFPRFLDILNHRFLQLFFRSWADARPIAQHDRPDADRFEAYVGSMVGIGSPHYRDLDSVADIRKLAYAGLMGPQAKSASRLKNLISGLFNVETEVEEFVGSWLAFEQSDRTRLGSSHSVLGVDALVGGSVFSVQDKIRVRIFARDLPQYQRFLPSGDLSEPLADSVFLYIGDQLDWDVELVLPASAVKPVELSRFGQLGWTSWVAPKWTLDDSAMRSDARFHVAERVGRKRKPVS
jgi:type VI secretion system protein ImpH